MRAEAPFPSYHRENKSYNSRLQQLVGQYLESPEFTSKALSKHTRNSYRGDLTLFAEFIDEQQLPLPLNPASIADYFKNVEQSKSTATLNRYLSSIKGFLDWISYSKPEYGYLVEALPQRPKRVDAKPLEYRILTDEEIERLRGVSSRNLRDLAIIDLMLATGANISEILNLTPADIDTDTGGPFMFPAVNVVFRGRKGHPERWVVLYPRTGNNLSKYLEENPTTTLNSPIFRGQRKTKAGPVSSHYALGREVAFFILKQYGREIGVPKLNAKMLRHTAISRWGNLSDKELAEHLGIHMQNVLKIRARLS